MFFIVGCGYLGEHVADLLHLKGHQVIAATHSADSASRLSQSKPYPVHPLDITQPNFPPLWQTLQPNITNILHCASTNRGTPDRAIEVYQNGSQHLTHFFPAATFNFVSSTSLYTQTDGSLVTEETSTANATSITAQALLAAEHIAIQHSGFAARLGGIYGPQRSHILKNFLQGTATIEGSEPQPTGRLLNQIHRNDAAQALVLLLLGQHQGIYNIVDDTPITQRECFTALAQHFQLPLPPPSPPNHQRKRAYTNKRISNAKIRALHWQPQYPSYLDALKNDPLLVPSILAQISTPSQLPGHEH